MLQIGQWVSINTRPTWGDRYFDADDIDTRDYVSCVRTREGHYVYELMGQDEDCLWTEDELTGLDDFEDMDEPTFWLGDEVHAGNIEDIQVITGISVSSMDNYEFVYELDEGVMYTLENSLKFKYDKDLRPAKYTLF